jgi:hypothetical protein
VLFVEPALGLAQSRRTGRRNRSRLLHAALFQAALGVGQPLRATFARAERLWQLVAALSSEALVLLGVDRVGVGEDLAREPLVIARRALGGVGMDRGAVDGEHLGAHQTGIRAQRQDLAEEPGQRLLVALTEPRDRRVVRDLVCREDAKRDVFLAGALDRPRRPDSTRLGIEQERHHHRRIERGPPVPVLAIHGVERGEIHLRDRLDHEPREVPLRQPIPDVRRQQKRLLTIGRDEVLAHTGIVLTAPD